MPGKDKLLSVCCLGYRHAPYVRDCITSIWQDSWPHIEIVAMDDGSRDGSVEMLKESLEKAYVPPTLPSFVYPRDEDESHRERDLLKLSDDIKHSFCLAG